MTFFKNAKEVTRCIGGLFDWAAEREELAERFKATGLVIRLNYREPDAVLTIDCKNPPEKPGRLIDWASGPGKEEPEVEFFMTADVGHRFWLGRVNLLVALAKKEIVAKGPILKVLKLLPILKPLYEQYPAVLERNGKRDAVKL